MNAREQFLSQFEDERRLRTEAALTDPLQTHFGGRFEQEWIEEARS